MTIKIYSTQGSRGMRPIWTAEEMGLDYEVEKASKTLPEGRFLI